MPEHFKVTSKWGILNNYSANLAELCAPASARLRRQTFNCMSLFNSGDFAPNLYMPAPASYADEPMDALATEGTHMAIEDGGGDDSGASHAAASRAKTADEAIEDRPVSSEISELSGDCAEDTGDNPGSPPGGDGDDGDDPDVAEPPQASVEHATPKKVAARSHASPASTKSKGSRSEKGGDKALSSVRRRARLPSGALKPSIG